jgi:thiol-disulfide isomerase/thioredoxin
MVKRAAVWLVPVLLWSGALAEGADNFKPFRLKTLDGESKTLEDVSGKATLVSFFFPSCKYCNAALPAVQKLADRYKDQGLAAVWINVLPEEDKKIAEWQAKNQFRVLTLRGASQASLQRDYKLKVTPTHYLLDASGKVLFTHAGYTAGDEKELEARIRKALGAE